MSASTRFATSIDAGRYGEYRAPTTVGAGELPAAGPAARPRINSMLEPGRYHLYGGQFDPASHRLEILRSLGGLEAAVSVSHVHGLRDARGWAFRPATGPDPVNGFTLLREAYEATYGTYSGPVSVPLLWDRAAGRIVSTDAVTIGLELIHDGGVATDALFSPADRKHIDAFDRWVTTAFRLGIPRAAAGGQATLDLAAALRQLDNLLTAHPFVLGDHLTDADIRLWVLLVRYDCGPNVHGRLGPRLSRLPGVWDWARSLYARAAFRDTTDFASFSAPLSTIPHWSAAATVSLA